MESACSGGQSLTNMTKQRMLTCLKKLPTVSITSQLLYFNVSLSTVCILPVVCSMHLPPTPQYALYPGQQPAFYTDCSVSAIFLGYSILRNRNQISLFSRKAYDKLITMTDWGARAL